MPDPLAPGVGALLLLDGFLALSGALLGLFFYGGLWLTVRYGMAFRQPALWVSASMLLRMGAMLGGFYAVGHGDLLRLLPCLIGFLAARAAVTWSTRLREPAPRHAPEGPRHAP